MAFCTTCGAAVDGKFCTNCGAVAGGTVSAPPPPGPAPIQPPPPQPPPAPAPYAQPQAGRSPWMYVAFGCLGIVALGIAGMLAIGYFAAQKVKQAGIDPDTFRRNPALAAAKVAAAMNPDVEFVSADEDRGVITLRDKKSGKTVTLNFEDVKRGKIVFTDDEGHSASAQLDSDGTISATSKDGTVHVGGTWDPPAWVPAYPGGKVKGGVSASKDGGESGTATFTTSDSPEKVIQYYRKAFEEKGMTVTDHEVSGLGKKIGAEDSQRKIEVVVTGIGGSSQVVVAYSNDVK